MLFLAGVIALGQTSQAPAAPRSGAHTPDTQPPKTETQPKEEISSKETFTTFKLRVNLVQVRVVVRDSKGRPVEGLNGDDFQLYDQGKLQTINTFGVETPELWRKKAQAAGKIQQATTDTEEGRVESDAPPQRFVALVFDDIHLKPEDIQFARANTVPLIDALAPTDRMAIYSTSGRFTLEFTSDKEALLKKLLSLPSRPLAAEINGPGNCPDVSHYMADQSENKYNAEILDVATQETLACAFHGEPTAAAAAQAMALIGFAAGIGGRGYRQRIYLPAAGRCAKTHGGNSRPARDGVCVAGLYSIDAVFRGSWNH
jgi:VWFA-related protein